MKMRAIFSKTGQAKYISHLDMQRTLERAFRRAQIPIAYSQGFNPKPRFSMASALMLGAESEGEAIDIHLAEAMDPEQFLAAMNANLPDGIRFVKAKLMTEEGGKDVAALAAAARYRITFGGLDGSIVEPAGEFVGARSIITDKQTKDGGTRQVDARKLVIAFRMLGDNQVEILLDISGPTMKPTEVASLILRGGHADAAMPEGVEIDVVRTEIMANVQDHYVPLFLV